MTHLKAHMLHVLLFLYISHIAFVAQIVVIWGGGHKTAGSFIILTITSPPSRGVTLHLHSLHTHSGQLLQVLLTEELLRLDRTECFVHDGAFSVSIMKM